MPEVRTRFAPSPTGFLHIGGVRTALFAWLVAKQKGGKFILRIEDTDKAREVSGSEQHIKDSLQWLGLNWDEEPYLQSQQLDLYREWGRKLLESGRAYADTRSPEELNQIRAQAAEQKKPVLFREHRLQDSPKWQEGMPLRFKSEPKAYSWHDEVMGELSTGPETVDDFILIKSDGFPTYNFAHIVDDHLMKVSHVIRSQEFLPSVPNYLNLYEALQIKKPALATLPYVMGPDGRKKLSKRDGAKDILDYKREGFLPDALVNFLATLGWNDGTKQEIFSRQELIERFDLSQVHKSGAQFDEQRLIWMNGHYIRELSLDELYKHIQSADESFWGKGQDQSEERKKQVLGVVQERLKHFSELPELTSFFFAEPTAEEVLALYKNPVDKQLKGLQPPELVEMLKAVRQELSASDFKQDDIAKRLNELLTKLQTKPGVLFSIIRIGITGAVSSPPIFGTLHVLGKEKSLNRLDAAIASLDK